MRTHQQARAGERGFTLTELLIGAALLVGGGGTLMVGMHYAAIHAEYLNQYQIAMNAAQGLVEQLAATKFDTLLGPQYAAARAGVQRCELWDLNCNAAADAGETVNNAILPSGALDVQIRQPSEDTLRNPADPALLDIHVAACWRSRGRPIGEDLNCNGAVDAGEDTNGNNWVDSPVMVSTRVGRRS